MTVFEKMRNKRIPDYYDGMYRDGWQPREILEAAHNSIMKNHDERDSTRPAQIHITSEVKTK